MPENRPIYRTAVLLHTIGQDSHYDWMLQTPTGILPPADFSPFSPTSTANSADARTLWTARIQKPPHLWSASGTMTLQPIAPHREAYLTYEGKISGQRGHVKRIASGTYTPLIWTHQHAKLICHWSQPVLPNPLTIEWHLPASNLLGTFWVVL